MDNRITTKIGAEPTVEDSSLRELRQVTWLGLFVNVGLTIIKFLAGIFGKSQVLVADAVHSLSDLVTDAAILIGSHYWDRPADKEHQHGHAKLETLVTLFIGLALGYVAMELIQNAFFSIDRIIKGELHPVPGWMAFAAAVLSIIAKEWIYRLTVGVGERIKSDAVIANAWHHRSDALSSIPAAASVGFCLIFGERYAFLDPVGTIVVSCIILYEAFKIIQPALSVLLDRGLNSSQIEEIRVCVLENEEVLGIHKIRTRPLGGGRVAVDLHLQVDPQMPVITAHRLSHHVAADIMDRLPEIVDVVAHLEPVRDEEKSSGQRERH